MLIINLPILTRQYIVLLEIITKIKVPRYGVVGNGNETRTQGGLHP